MKHLLGLSTILVTLTSCTITQTEHHHYYPDKDTVLTIPDIIPDDGIGCVRLPSTELLLAHVSKGQGDKYHVDQWGASRMMEPTKDEMGTDMRKHLPIHDGEIKLPQTLNAVMVK